MASSVNLNSKKPGIVKYVQSVRNIRYIDIENTLGTKCIVQILYR